MKLSGFKLSAEALYQKLDSTSDDINESIKNTLETCLERCKISLEDLTKDIVNSLEGFDWINLFTEDEREEVLSEFNSCLSMNRRFSKVARMQNGKTIRLLGYPYRISDLEHGGFLISITEENEV